MGAALFSGPRMTGTLTGNEVSLLCLMTGKASKRVSVIDGAQYKTRLQTRVKRRIDPDGTLFVALRLTLTLSAGQQQRTGRKSPPRLRRTASACCTSSRPPPATRSALAAFRSAAIPISRVGALRLGGAIQVLPRPRERGDKKSCNSVGANRIFVSAEKPFFIIQTGKKLFSPEGGE